MNDRQRAERDGLSRREILVGLGTAAAGLPMVQMATAAEHAPSVNPAATAESDADLVDDHFVSDSSRHFGSQVIHCGEMSGYNVTPISQDKASPCYQRPGNMSNPTVAPLLQKMKEIEGTERAIGAPCGMGIISQTYLALLKPGDRVLTHRCNYDWVMTLFRQYLPSCGVDVEFLDLTNPDELAASLKAKPAKIVHWEPYVNPTMEVLDTPALIRIAKQAGAIVVVDNTWLTPYLFQPARLGADLVIHSVTKYVGGHGNAMGGVVSGRKDLVGRIESAQNWLGGLLRPMDAFLVTQGIKTLPMRMRQHCQSAQKVAEFLQSHPAVARVRYGGLPAWNAKSRFLNGFGGMLGVEWKNDSVHQRLGRHVRLIIEQTSLGDPVTRINKRGEDKDRGIPPRYTRVSIGLEEPEDIIADLRQAIAKCG
ncbi:MAG: aminotransferase class V-fold PLP-dependent enzyme [Planctomycetes bacterium]|nr:aminotransferase class V-fold PLP-dependent enzyme [Planctomycetota bacterium]